jgi:hypothetical protein
MQKSFEKDIKADIKANIYNNPYDIYSKRFEKMKFNYLDTIELIDSYIKGNPKEVFKQFGTKS